MSGYSTWRQGHGLCLLIVLGVALVLVLPMLLTNCPQGHDIRHHLIFSHHFTEQFWQGELYPRWLQKMNAGFGSPTFFYAPLPFWITALLAGQPALDRYPPHLLAADKPCPDLQGTGVGPQSIGVSPQGCPPRAVQLPATGRLLSPHAAHPQQQPAHSLASTRLAAKAHRTGHRGSRADHPHPAPLCLPGMAGQRWLGQQPASNSLGGRAAAGQPAQRTVQADPAPATTNRRAGGQGHLGADAVILALATLAAETQIRIGITGIVVG